MDFKIDSLAPAFCYTNKFDIKPNSNYLDRDPRQELRVARNMTRYINPRPSTRSPAHSMAVAAGESHTVVVGEDGNMFAFGTNILGQIGTIYTTDMLDPTPVAGLPPSLGPVRQIATGFNHTGIVTDAGDLLMCGFGRFGQLGLGPGGSMFHRKTPTLVPRASFDDEAVLMVACGGLHTVAVTEAGGVFTFGDGDDHQLGHGARGCQRTPLRVPAAGFHNERVVMAAAGNRHTVALSEAGHVFTWGFGMSGCLGHGDRRSKRVPLKIEPARFQGDDNVVYST